MEADDARIGKMFALFGARNAKDRDNNMAKSTVSICTIVSKFYSRQAVLMDDTIVEFVRLGASDRNDMMRKEEFPVPPPSPYC